MSLITCSRNFPPVDGCPPIPLVNGSKTNWITNFSQFFVPKTLGFTRSKRESGPGTEDRFSLVNASVEYKFHVGVL
jgi:hypothetical protein